MNLGIVERIEAELRCHICLEAPRQPRTLACEHHFCSECIGRAMREAAVCPVCKADAPRRSIREDEPLVLGQWNRVERSRALTLCEAFNYRTACAGQINLQNY